MAVLPRPQRKKVTVNSAPPLLRKIAFDDLYLLFAPDDLVYTGDYDSIKEPRCSKVDRSTFETNSKIGRSFCIEARHLDFEDSSYGLLKNYFVIFSYEGKKTVTSLPCYPLHYHKSYKKFKNQFLVRGERLLALKSIDHKRYKGFAYGNDGRATVFVDGRIMIDSQYYLYQDFGGLSTSRVSQRQEAYVDGQIEPLREEKAIADCDKDQPLSSKKIRFEDHWTIWSYKPETVAQKRAKSRYTEDELMTATPIVRGFAFKECARFTFRLSCILDIEWEEGISDSLVLPDDQKDIIKAHVSSSGVHTVKNADDRVLLRSTGLLALLQGPTGTGKTLTAEITAESLKCPLYAISTADLANVPHILDSELQELCGVAQRWGAVLLLKGAETLLERDRARTVDGAAIISLLQRVMEHTRLIVFLSTNSKHSLDAAFTSRLPVAIHYKAFDEEARQAVWANTLLRAQRNKPIHSVDWIDEDLQRLSHKSLNGHQIKNCVRTARLLAVSKGERLSMKHMQRVTKVLIGFNERKEIDLDSTTHWYA